MTRVVITGIGTVNALGNSLEESLKNAIAGKSGIRRCDELLWEDYGKDLKCRVGGTVKNFDARKYVPEKYLDIYDPATIYAIAAAQEAIADAKLDLSETERAHTGVLVGIAGPANQLNHRIYHKVMVQKQAARLSGALLPQLSGHIASSLIALAHKFQGPTMGIIDACATGATALACASDTIRAGRAKRVIVGGTDAPIGLLSFGSMLQAGAMKATDDPERACTPFSKDRAGLIIGEGSAMFVMETLEEAKTRGARIYAELVADAQTNDAHHVYSPEPTGASWARTMQTALDRAGLSAADVDLVSAHAASTPIGDVIETRAIKRVFGDKAHAVPVVATKAMHGHAFGAAGAIESALAIGAMHQDTVLPTINLTEPDPECDLDYVPNRARAHRINVIMKNSFGFGGTNTTVIFRRVA